MALLKRHEIPAHTTINLMPLIDVVLQLLIFLMLTSSMVRPNQIELNLPPSTSGVKAVENPTAVVTYRRTTAGRPEITLNAEAVKDLQELTQCMRAVRETDQDMQVDIQVERTVQYQDVIAVIDAVRDAGFQRFSLLTLATSRRNPKEE